MRFADGHELITCRGTFRSLAVDKAAPTRRKTDKRVARCAGCGAALSSRHGEGHAVFYHLLRNSHCTNEYVNRGRLVKFSAGRRLAVVDSLHVIKHTDTRWIVWGISPNSSATNFGQFRTRREARELIAQKREEFDTQPQLQECSGVGTIWVSGVCPHCGEEPIVAAILNTGPVLCYMRTTDGKRGGYVKYCRRCGGDLSQLEREIVIEQIHWT